MDVRFVALQQWCHPAANTGRASKTRQLGQRSKVVVINCMLLFYVAVVISRWRKTWSCGQFAKFMDERCSVLRCATTMAGQKMRDNYRNDQSTKTITIRK